MFNLGMIDLPTRARAERLFWSVCTKVERVVRQLSYVPDEMQTLSRTLVTSMTTVLVLLALFLLGGEIIHGFAFALLIGVLIGTYSSIYVAANVLLMMGVSKEDLMIPVKEGAEQEDLMP